MTSTLTSMSILRAFYEDYGATKVHSNPKERILVAETQKVWIIKATSCVTSSMSRLFIK